MELLTAWNSRASAISYAPIIPQTTCTSSHFQRPSLPPHQLSFPFCPCPFRFVPNKSLALRARKRNSEPEQHPLLRPTIIEEVSEDDEDDDVILDDFEDGMNLELQCLCMYLLVYYIIIVSYDTSLVCVIVK